MRDYSEHGVLLKCVTSESRQKDVALNAGDEVSVRFWDQRVLGGRGEVKGKISRIIENGVAVEYSESGSASNEKLLSLLNKNVNDDSIETDSSEKRSTPRLTTLENEETIMAGRADQALEAEPGDDIAYQRDQADGRPRLLIGGVVLGVLGLLAVGLYGFNLSNRIDEVSQQVVLLQAQQSKQANADAIPGLTQRTVRLEETQRQMAEALSETASQAALQETRREIELELAKLKTKPAESVAATASNVETPKPTPNNADKPEWVIHLATLSDPIAADKIIAKAKSLGLDVYKSRVSVNDQQMHRLSIKGLSSRQDAEMLASKAQQQLALTRKPWIAKQ